ncbi:unnamed protein product [Caenorhabditis bovis]|uniref:Uncharacterized protein n=1 Tax=Caenorhabditis bovis TaxID=2654633 RepID=A0A8S1EHN1_9PELO|nr:unnamed protein product [Caenorhabditis bovis]
MKEINKSALLGDQYIQLSDLNDGSPAPAPPPPPPPPPAQQSVPLAPPAAVQSVSIKQENAPLLGSDSGTERQMNPSDPGKSENSNRPGASSIPAKSGTGVLRICMIINAIVIILLVPFWVLIILCGLQFITIDFMENLMNSIGGLI